MADSGCAAHFSIIGAGAYRFLVDRHQVPCAIAGFEPVDLLAGILEARAQVTGVAYSSNYLYEALADLSVTPFPFLDIHGGYKVIRLKIDRNDNFLDAQFAGPYVGLTVSF